MAWKVYGERTLYDNPWVRLVKVDVEPPGGHRFEHHVVRLQRVAVAVVLDERDRVLMLGDGVVATQDSRGKKMTRRYCVHIGTALLG